MSDERGSAALEITLIAPLLVLMLLFVVGLGRLAQARGEVDGAARDAARAASIARSPGAADADARTAAAATLADRSITCASLDVVVDTTEFRPSGNVVVHITCTVKLSDLVGVGFGSDRDLHGRAVAVIDSYRGVSG
jgi:Flp pilus assembly protein TadG